MYVVITGATKGLGYELAKVYAKLGRNLILVARTKHHLEEAYTLLTSQYDINVIILATDLSTIDGVNELIKLLDKKQFNIFINNAGFGLVEYFDSSNNEIELNMVNLNIIGFYELFKYSYKKLMNVKNSHILNVGSVASFLPGPKASVYFATKSFIKSLTDSVQYEAKKFRSSVTISLLCPPPLETDFMKRANMHIKGNKISVDKVAKIAVKQMEKGKQLILPGIKTKLIYYTSKFAPFKIVRKVMYRKVMKRNKKV